MPAAKRKEHAKGYKVQITGFSSVILSQGKEYRELREQFCPIRSII
jgi:hypothetical protein